MIALIGARFHQRFYSSLLSRPLFGLIGSGALAYSEDVVPWKE